MNGIVAAVALLAVAGCGGAQTPQTAQDGGTGGNGASDGGTADAGTSGGGAPDGGAAPKCSPAGAVKCGGDGDGDGKGDGDLLQCDPSYGWIRKQTCEWTCQDGACGVCALENQPCRYSSDCSHDGYGLMTCIEVGGSDPCGLGNGTNCVCIYDGYALGCAESMECAPGYHCASDGICRPGCYSKNEPCFSDDQCCSGKCQMYPDQCSGDCA